MKRFLSMLATLVLVGQSVVTPAVYATQGASENEESVSEAVVETTIDESDADDGSSDDEVVADSTNDAEESAELEEIADAEESLETDNSETSEEPEAAEEAEVAEETTSEAVEAEKVEETADVEEISTEDEESSIEEPVSYGKSFSSQQQEKSWTEISENRLVVTVVDSLGAFPEGTEMVVKAVEEDHIFDLVNDAIDANVTKVKAVDITFWYNEEEIQPEQPINVKISALNMAEPQAVVHIDAEYNDEKIEVGEADVEEIDSEINGKTAEFEAESFSIYVIAEVDRLQVNFKKADGSVLASGVIRNTADLESFIYYPEVSDLGENEIFRGWNNSSEYTTGTSEVDVKAEIESKYDELVANEDKNFDEIDFYAMIFKHYTITYQDEDGVVIHTDELLFTGESQTYVINRQYTPKYQDSNFEGWKKVVNGIVTGDPIENEISENIEGDLILRAYAPQGYWLVFKENGKGVSYTPPQFVKTVTVEPSDPSRLGYDFGGWYMNESCTGNKFTFGGELTERTVLYAKWTTGTTADYTVLIRKQNVAGDGYDFVESVTVEDAVVGTTPTAVNESDGKVSGAAYNGEVGFSYKSTDQASKTVGTEGNTVVNVYYDRNEYTLTFNVPSKVNNPSNSDKNLYGYDDDMGYVKLTRRSNKWQYEKTTTNFRGFTTTNRTTYNGTFYHFDDTIKEITGLYGQNIRSNFPIEGTNGINYAGASWSSNGSTIFNDENYISYIDTMQAESTTFRLAYNPTNNYYTYHVKYYVEALPTDTNTVTYEGKKFVLYHDAEIHFQSSELKSTETEEFTDITGFEKYGSYPEYSEGKADFDNDNTISLYYTRKYYPINFMDGVYVDGNNNSINEEGLGQLSTVQNIVYGGDVSSYNSYKPTQEPAGYVFEGWYLDDACSTEPYVFTTMPEGGLTVYAKWVQKQYRVFLHPDPKNDKDESLDLGDQETSFRVSYGEQISDGNAIGGTRDDYELIGWYTEYNDETFKNPFNFASYVLNDTTVTTQYNKTESTETDKYGNPKEGQENVNTDKDRFRINTKLDLYAKWRSKLEGASGMNIIYDAGEGSNAPKDEGLYLDLAEALAGPAATAPSGKQFKYWVVQKWNGSVYENTDITVYPGETFEVLKANAKKVAKPDNTAENPSYTYTVQLRAEYKTGNEQEQTAIQYCPNYDGAEECTDPETIDVDVEFTTTGEIFTRDGYTFSGWNTQADGKGTDFGTGVSGLAADNLGVEENKVNVLYAIWNVNQYTVKFVDAEDVLSEEKYDYGTLAENIDKPADPTKSGYVFSGWTPEIVNVVADAIYVAEWNEDSNGNGIADKDEAHFTVTYKDGVNGEVFADQVTENILSGSATPAFTGSKERSGYVFSGWNPEVAETVLETVTYVAEWNEDSNGNGIADKDEAHFTVTYKDGVNGEVFADQVTENILSGSATPAFTGSKERSGYVFSGWNPEVAETVLETVTYVAEWNEDSNGNGIADKDEAHFTVTYKDGVNGEVFADQVTENILSGSATPAFTGSKERSGYVFSGWNPEVAETVLETVTYVAEWNEDSNGNGIADKDEAHFTVTYKDGVNGEVFADQVTENILSGSATPAFTGSKERSGYVFSGWNPEVAETVLETVTYVAEWNEDSNGNGIADKDEAHFTVTYKDGVNGEVFADQVTENILSGSATPAFTGSKERSGYVFSGWNPEVAETVLETVTYVAEWNEDSNGNGIADKDEAHFTVTYKDGVNGEVFADQVTENILSGSATPAFTGSKERSGYVFSGWNPEVAETVLETVTYVAEWNEDSNGNGIADKDEAHFTVTYKDGVNGEVFADQVTENILSGSATPAFTGSKERSGYVFSGWNPEVAETVLETVTYVAEWNEDSNGNGIADKDEAHFTVTYKDGVNGEVFADQVTENILSGSATPAFTGSKERSGYVFSGWNPEVAETVLETVTYVAEWNEDSNGNGIADKDEAHFTVTYKDGVNGEVFADQVTENILSGSATPAFTGSKERSGYVFSGWNPEVAETVLETVTYVAEWNEDSNGNGIADKDEAHFTVTYKDGVNGEVFADQVTENILSGSATPAFTGSKERSGYVFSGWNPEVAETVLETVTYVAEWNEDSNGNGIADKDEAYTVIFVNYDGTVLQSGDVAYGETPVYSGETPTKEGEGYEYTHSGWNPDIEPVTTGATYTAKYSAVCTTGYHDQRLEGNNAVAGRVNPTVTSTTTEDPICVNNEKKTGVECTQGNKPAHSHYTVTTGAGSWNGQMYVGEDCPWECDNGYHKDGNVCKANGGGGGGGSTPSDPYRCEDLPDNAVANNTDKPNKRTTYTYDEDTSKVCTFQCKSGYTRDKENKECVKSENPGGGNGGNNEEEIELGGQVSDKCSVEGFEGSEEEKAAYLYACENDITTIRDINEARLRDFLNRAEMAKMVSVFATKELGMKPNTSKDCSNFAESIAHYSQEMKDYMVMSCQLELMGIHTVNYEPIPDFMPSKRVSRAEFGTVLSRVLWGNKYEGTNSNYYINHLNALKENNIITNINPNITEYRAWVFLMLYRAVEAIKVLKSTNNVAIDQQVNEELQEEGKAETGLVVEYDSGSVVPDMATLTESGTLATGAVAKVESGNVAESQTGATTLTGEDTSKEVSAETGAVAETGSTSD